MSDHFLFLQELIWAQQMRSGAELDMAVIRPIFTADRHRFAEYKALSTTIGSFSSLPFAKSVNLQELCR